MSFVIIPKKDPKKLQNLWAPSLTTVHISLVGWDQDPGSMRNATHTQKDTHSTPDHGVWKEKESAGTLNAATEGGELGRSGQGAPFCARWGHASTS